MSEEVTTEVIEQPVADLETTESEAVEAAEEQEQPEPPKEKDPWYKRRIDELTKEKWEARRQSERLEQALAQQQAILERLAPQQAPEPQISQLQPPNPENYSGGQYDPRFQQDMYQYIAAKSAYDAQAAVRAEFEQREQQQQIAQQQARIKAAEAEARQRLPDYDAVIANVINDQTLMQSDTIRQAMLGMDNGPEVAYLLGRNPELAYEIATLPPIAAGIKLAGLLNQQPTASKAPPPIKPINGVSGGSGKKAYADMSPAEFIAARNAEEKAKREARYKR